MVISNQEKKKKRKERDILNSEMKRKSMIRKEKRVMRPPEKVLR